MVIVVAVDMVSHAGTPTPLSLALVAIRENVLRTFGGAFNVPGNAWAALMSCFNGSESFDMLIVDVEGLGELFRIR
jgi:hypothetical protein